MSGFSVALRLAKPAACVSKRPKHVLHARHAVARAPARAGTPLGDAARAAADHVQAPRDREPGTRAAQREGASCFVPARRTRQLPRNDPTGPDRTLLSYPQLRQDLADARRRATVAANAEAQAGIVVAMHREKQAEAARLRRELLVRDEGKTRKFRLLSKHISARRLSPRGRKKMVSLTSSRTRSSRLNLDQPGRGARGDPQAQDPGGRAGQSAAAPARAPSVAREPIDGEKQKRVRFARRVDDVAKVFSRKFSDTKRLRAALARAVVADPRRLEHAPSTRSFCAGKRLGERRVASVTEKYRADDAPAGDERGPAREPPRLRRARDGDAGGGDETSDARKKKRPNVRRVRTSADLDAAPRAQAQTQAGGVHGTEPEDEDAKAAHASPRGARAGVGGGGGEPRVFGRRKKPTLSGNRRNGGGGRRRRRRE